MEPGSHGTARVGVKPVPGAADVGPSRGEGAGASRVIPGATIEDPAGSHRAGGAEPVRGAVACVKARHHGAARPGIEPVPGTSGAKPTGTQCNRIGRIRVKPLTVNRIPALLPFNGSLSSNLIDRNG